MPAIRPLFDSFVLEKLLIIPRYSFPKSSLLAVFVASDQINFRVIFVYITAVWSSRKHKLPENINSVRQIS